MARNVVTLASWRLRRTWGLLAIIGVGMMVAVTLVCVAPLYSEVTMTAGLRASINSSPSDTSPFGGLFWIGGGTNASFLEICRFSLH